MSNQAGNLMNEQDIGSGDKTPADHETEKLIEEIGKDRKNSVSQEESKRQADAANRQRAATEKR